MKTILNKKVFLVFATFIVAASGCRKDLQPYDSKSNKVSLATPDDLQIATYGTYSGLVLPNYERLAHFLAEYGGDNVALSGNTGDPLRNVYNYDHIPTSGLINNFWSQAYKVIFSANGVITHIQDGESQTLDQLKGENLFIRAMVHFDLVRFYGRPYSQGGGNNPGVVIKDNTDNGTLPLRSTVKEVYDFIVSDLTKAVSLMTVPKTASFATREAAQALLSRVYLYEENNQQAINYADSVINSNRYQLLLSNAYKTFFTLSPDANTETIFAIHNTMADNLDKGSIGSMYYNDPATGTSGWGQVYASLAYMDLLNKYPEDVRHSFVEVQLAPNGTDTLKRGNVPKIYVNKYSWQEGAVNLSSPVYLRLAEMYLNRAEANAKLGNGHLAIEDVNVVRRRAGLSGSELYTVDDLKGHASVFDVVLEERRLELAFEAQRPLDLFRNNLPLIRAYPGFHSADRYNQTILPNSPLIIQYIPERETIVNPNLDQNP